MSFGKPPNPLIYSWEGLEQRMREGDKLRCGCQMLKSGGKRQFFYCVKHLAELEERRKRGDTGTDE